MERLAPPWSGAREGLRGRGFAGQGWQAYVWKVKEVRAGQVCPARMFEIVKREHDRLGGFLVLQHQRGVSQEKAVRAGYVGKRSLRRDPKTGLSDCVRCPAFLSKNDGAADIDHESDQVS